MVALNTAYAAPKNAADPKNRVGDFFHEDHASVGKNRWAKRLNAQEKSSYHYETASGRSNWSNRDPIRELGGLNVYNFTFNNSINYVDSLGRVACAPYVVYGVWVVGKWAVHKITRKIVSNMIVTTTIYVANQSRTVETTEYEDKCNQCVAVSTDVTTETEEIFDEEVTEEPVRRCNWTGKVEERPLGKHCVYSCDGIGEYFGPAIGISDNCPSSIRHPDDE